MLFPTSCNHRIKFCALSGGHRAKETKRINLDERVRKMVTNTQTNQTCQLLTATDAAKLCRLSKRSWFRLSSAGKIPAPVHIGGSVRWRQKDIEDYIAWDCPDRKAFEAMRRAENVRQ